MGISILAIDNNKLFSKKLEDEWGEKGFTIERIDDIKTAIILVQRYAYVFVGINGDSEDYLMELLHLREATLLPILIGVDFKSYSVHSEIKALENGADSFGVWSENTPENVQNALAKINRINKREHQKKVSQNKKRKVITILSSDEIVLSTDYRVVLVNGQAVKLTRKEFEILFVIMHNTGMVLSYSQIFRLVWGDEYEESPYSVIRPHISRIRSKINHDKHNYIQSESGVGYKFVKK